MRWLKLLVVAELQPITCHLQIAMMSKSLLKNQPLTQLRSPQLVVH